MSHHVPKFPVQTNTGSLHCHIAAFIETRKAAGRSPGTLRFYQDTLLNFAAFCPDWPPTVECLRSFFSHKRDEGCKETTLNTYYRSLSVFLNWCEGEGLISANPLDRVEKPGKPKKIPRVLAPKTLRRLFAVLENHATRDDTLAIRDLAMFRLCYDTGCRATELGRLRLDDLDIARHEVRVQEGKGDQDRYVYFGHRCAEVLRNWLAVHPGGKWLFPSRLRTELRPLTRRGVYQALKRWCRVAEVQSTVHQFRHSYATHALRRGIDIEHVKNQLGHSTITVTAIYLAAADEERRRAHLQKAPGDDV